MTSAAPVADWDDAYANMAHVPGSDRLPELWATRADAFRRDWPAIEAGVAYGDHDRERLDLVRPEGTPRGLAVFVHGGYWMATDRTVWTHLARGAAMRGWAVALPSYVLAPEARLSRITAQVGAAVARAAAMVDGPVRIAGHSAGGHLASRMACEDAPLPRDVAARVDGVLSISGLHDLRPLMRTAMNDTLRIDEAEALAESPALLRPRDGARVTGWAGGVERPEFVRQTLLLANVWHGLGAATQAVVEAGHDHFSVVDGLTQPDAPITEAFVGGG